MENNQNMAMAFYWFVSVVIGLIGSLALANLTLVLILRAIV